MPPRLSRFRLFPLRPMRSALDAPPVPQRDLKFQVLSYEDIPLERLRPHLDPHAVEAAIARALVCGVRQLGGCLIWEEISRLERGLNPEEALK